MTLVTRLLSYSTANNTFILRYTIGRSLVKCWWNTKVGEHAPKLLWITSSYRCWI